MILKPALNRDDELFHSVLDACEISILDVSTLEVTWMKII